MAITSRRRTGSTLEAAQLPDELAVSIITIGELRRPFLVMTRSAVIPVLHNLLAAPVTRTVRSIPTELLLGPDDGMPTDCAASFDNLRVVPKAYLVDRQCALGAERMIEACASLRAAVDC